MVTCLRSNRVPDGDNKLDDFHDQPFHPPKKSKEIHSYTQQNGLRPHQRSHWCSFSAGFFIAKNDFNDSNNYIHVDKHVLVKWLNGKTEVIPSSRISYIDDDDNATVLQRSTCQIHSTSHIKREQRC